MEWVELLPEERWRHEAHGRVWKYLFGVFIVRSGDGGRTWDYVTQFDPNEVKPVYGISDRPVDEGFDEAHMTKLPNGDILCVMRTGSYSPLWQTRSRDGGRTWDTPESMGWPGAKPQLQVLPNGVLACASGRGSYGHPQVTHVMISIDGTGHQWEAPFNFHTGPGCSYTHDHAARRQAARDLLGLGFHTRHGNARAARATHSPRRHRHLDRRMIAAGRVPNWEHA